MKSAQFAELVKNAETFFIDYAEHLTHRIKLLRERARGNTRLIAAGIAETELVRVQNIQQKLLTLMNIQSEQIPELAIDKLVSYLQQAQQTLQRQITNSQLAADHIPNAAHNKDNQQGLHLLDTINEFLHHPQLANSLQKNHGETIKNWHANPVEEDAIDFITIKLLHWLSEKHPALCAESLHQVLNNRDTRKKHPLPTIKLSMKSDDYQNPFPATFSPAFKYLKKYKKSVTLEATIKSDLNQAIGLISLPITQESELNL